MASLISSTAIALGIGLLIGIERERSKGSGPQREVAGVRTFALVALLGAFGAILGTPLLIAVFAVLVGVMTIAGARRAPREDPGITTEIALLATFALGALSFAHPAYSAGAAVVVTVLLASRAWLHEAVKRRLSDRELHDGLLLAAAALVVLPLLPDRNIDPWNVFNPHKMWIVIVLVMALNALGYVGLRAWGPQRGLILAGVLGGLVSSAATHGAMGQRAAQNRKLAGSAAAAAILSSATTAMFLLVVVGAVDVTLAAALAWPCGAAALVCVSYGVLLYRQAEDIGDTEVASTSPLSLRAALLFGAMVSGVLMVSVLLSRSFGAHAAIASTAAAGFADAHSGSISAASLLRNEVMSAYDAQLAILLSFSTNAITKIVISMVMGTAAYAWHVLLATTLAVSAAWLAWWFGAA